MSESSARTKTVVRSTSDQDAEVHQQQKHTAQIASIIIGAVIVILAVIYCIGCFYFYDRFWPHTMIGSADVSSLTSEEAIKVLQDTSDNSTMRVSGQGVDFTLTGANAGLELNVESAIDSVLSESSSWAWPLEVFRTHDESDVLITSYDTDLLYETIDAELAAFNSMATDPSDAFLYYDELTQTYKINKGSMGTKLDVDSVVDTVVNALVNQQDYASLTSANLVPQSVSSNDEWLTETMDAANYYLSCNLDLIAGDIVVATVDASVIHNWIVIDDDHNVFIDDTQLAAWVDTVEDICDTYGTTRYYTRFDGKEIVVEDEGEGCYGWISYGAGIENIVRDAVNNAVVGSADVPFRVTASTFTINGPDWAGSNYVDVDLTEQHVYYYAADGTVLWESDCISGATDGEHESPTGVYYVNAKMTDQTLIGKDDPETGEPEYETFVNYWMPFVGNYIGLHDATWQPGFGGTMNQDGYGSHGCINLPYIKTVELWNMLEIGTPVVVHY